MSHRALWFAKRHVRLDHLQHMRGDFVHILQGPDAECNNRPVVLRQEDKHPQPQSIILKKTKKKRREERKTDNMVQRRTCERGSTGVLSVEKTKPTLVSVQHPS